MAVKVVVVWSTVFDTHIGVITNHYMIVNAKTAFYVRPRLDFKLYIYTVLFLKFLTFLGSI